MTLCENAHFFKNQKRKIYDFQDNSVFMITKTFKKQGSSFWYPSFLCFSKAALVFMPDLL